MDNVFQISSNEKKNIVSQKSWQRKKLTFVEHLMYKAINARCFGHAVLFSKNFQRFNIPHYSTQRRWVNWPRISENLELSLTSYSKTNTFSFTIYCKDFRAPSSQNPKRKGLLLTNPHSFCEMISSLNNNNCT